MIDLIVFSVGSNRYALNIENVQRIIQASQLTDIPNAHEYIDGMMSYEDRVLKVLNFRKLISLKTYNEELKILFMKLKQAHVDWVDALKNSIENGAVFSKTTNPHACELGKWIDSFTAYDDRVTEVLNELVEYHKLLHTTGGNALDIYKKDPQKAKKILDIDISLIYEHTIGALDIFVKELDLVANSLQKLIIYDKGDMTFAIKVDTIEDIAHVSEKDLISSDEQKINEYLELDAILDLDGILINVIKTVTIPS
jgi:purine-binding chemotaxis protein CheW